MAKKIIRSVFKQYSKNFLWGVFLSIIIVLPTDSVFAVCKDNELSERGVKLLNSGTRYEKNNTNYKVCRLQNGGLLWALDINQCHVVRIREKYPKNKLVRKVSRPELIGPRKIAELNYIRANPKLVSCKSIRVDL